MTHYSMTVDVDKCTGCYACFLACRDEFKGNDYLPYSLAQPAAGQSWIRVEETERGTFPKVKVAYTPIMCQQCEDAPCIEATSNDAVYRNEEGIILIDPQKAVGQKAISESCPYGVISWNEEQNLAQKCTFCTHLKGATPRCVDACPVDVIQIVKTESAAPENNQLHPEYGLNPSVSYSGLPKKFIAGEIVVGADDNEECAANVTVTLKNGAAEQTTVTDAFGDFEFDGLVANGDYTVLISYGGYAPIELPVSTASDVNLGVITLEP